MDREVDSTHKKNEYSFLVLHFLPRKALNNIFHFKGTCSVSNTNLGVKILNIFSLQQALLLLLFFLLESEHKYNLGFAQLNYISHRSMPT